MGAYVAPRGVTAVTEALGPFLSFVGDPALDAALRSPDACDFVFGNPHEVASDRYVDAFLTGVRPQGPAHYAYTMNDPEAVRVVADGLTHRFGIEFSPSDVFMTNGNFAGLAIALRALVEPGDEVVFMSPPWFFYEALIVAAGATPVRVLADRTTWGVDLEALDRAITPATRAVLVNTPTNPTGRVLDDHELRSLASLLDAASRRNGRPVYLLSDEAYSRIVFDGRRFVTPLQHYEHALMLYTYGKAHLAPGNRLGYIALPPTMPDRHALGEALLLGQLATGWSFPVAPLQHAMAALDDYVVDIAALERRRDVVCDALEAQGYTLVRPEGTFYVTAQSPDPDDAAFCARLAARAVHVLPGYLFEMPGWFRLSLTANDAMVARALPVFADERSRVAV